MPRIPHYLSVEFMGAEVIPTALETFADEAPPIPRCLGLFDNDSVRIGDAAETASIFSGAERLETTDEPFILLDSVF